MNIIRYYWARLDQVIQATRLLATGFYTRQRQCMDSKIKIFTPSRPDWSWGPFNLLYNQYWDFPGGKFGRSIGITTKSPSDAVDLWIYGRFHSHSNGMLGRDPAFLQPSFDSRQVRNLNSYLGSGTGSIYPHEDK